MKKAVFKAEPPQGGFIRSTIAPVNEKSGLRFGMWDAVEVVILIAGLLIAMRLLLAR